jgi:hypothetical protein
MRMQPIRNTSCAMLIRHIYMRANDERNLGDDHSKSLVIVAATNTLMIELGGKIK